MNYIDRTLGSFSDMKYGKMPNKKAISDNGKYPIFSGYRIVGYCNECNLEKQELIVIARGVGGTGCVKLSPGACFLTNLSIAVLVDEKVALKKYLYYYFRQSGLRYLDSGSAQSQITISDLRNVRVRLPSINIQEKVVELLSLIDSKIEINKAINDNLERQATAYFQELFVANANPNWKTGTISSLGTVIGGSTPSKAKPEYYTDNGIAWITPKELSINKSKFISHGETDITELGLKNTSASIMPEGTVLFSSRAPIGYIAISNGEVTTNQGFKSVVPKPEIGTAFVYFFLKNNLPTIEGAASGSTFKEVSGSTMKNVPAVIPDTGTLAKFNDFCSPLFNEQKNLEQENQHLASLRDTLLPKLMSGEIDVSNIQL